MPASISQRLPEAMTAAPTQRRWCVIAGEVYQIVEADSFDEALTNFFKLLDEIDQPPRFGAWLSVVEVVGEELFIRTEEALRQAGRLVETEMT